MEHPPAVSCSRSVVPGPDATEFWSITPETVNGETVKCPCPGSGVTVRPGIESPGFRFSLFSAVISGIAVASSPL
jgi:hypothetical protein